MLTPQQMLKIDPELSDLAAEELDELRVALYEIGQLAFDVWWDKKRGSKNPVGLFPNSESENKITP